MNTERELRRLIRKSMRDFRREQITCIEPGCQTISLNDRCERHQPPSERALRRTNNYAPQQSTGPSAASQHAAKMTAKFGQP